MNAREIEEWVRLVAVRLIIFAVGCFCVGYLS